MDASQYKDYILTLLFMKHVFDTYADDPFALIDIPDEGRLCRHGETESSKAIGDKFNKIIGKFA